MSVTGLIKKPVRAIIGKVQRTLSEREVRNLYRAKTMPAHEYLKANPMPELTEAQRKEIDSFWSQYGIRILDYSWFRWYYGVTGIEDPRFIPQDVYSYIIWPYHDNEEFCLAWKDKNLFERFVPGIPFPKNYIRRIHGRFFDGDGNYLPDENTVIMALSHVGEVIVKDAWDSGEGRGVTKYALNNEADIRKLLTDWNHSDNYLVQELIQQNRVFSQFNESSVNIMRINTWRQDDEVHVFCPTLRIGAEGSTTDICYIDGVEIARTCAITLDGHFGNRIVNQHGRVQITSETVELPDVIIPKWEEVVKLAMQGHKMLDHFDIVGWDFTVTNDERIICIEYNIKRPGTVFYQHVNGPFFGEYTEQVLAFLKDKNNQVKYIPEWMRL